jgi:SAM-dependent methyltransferase
MIDTPDPMRDPMRERFYETLNLPGKSVLEIGTRRWNADKPTIHRPHFPNVEKYIGIDCTHGLDVDFVVDAQELSAHFNPGIFDGILCVATLEHIARPWIVAKEFATVLKRSGLVYVETHQTFVLHEFPHDYWRFTIEALAVLFGDAGFETLDARYFYPCRIVPEEPSLDWDEPRPASWLNVACLCQKI